MGIVRITRWSALAAALAALLPACKDENSDAPGGCVPLSAGTTGPGDALDHLPLLVGSTWTYRIVESDGQGTWTRRERLRVTGSRAVAGFATTVLTVTELDDPAATPHEVLLAKGPSEIIRVVDPATAAPAEAAFGSYEILEFPVEPGLTFVARHCENVEVPNPEPYGGAYSLDLHSEVTVVGDETVTVPAGTFTATRVETHDWMLSQTASDGAFASETTATDWYAPGVGLVRSTFVDSSGILRYEESLVGYTVEGREGGLLELRTLATGLAPPDSDTTTPGRPAIAFDGTGDLLVSKVSSGTWAQDSVRAFALNADGSVGSGFDVSSRRGYGARTALAFDGTNHLVVSSLCEGYCTTLFGQRITPAGTLLDGTAGFDIPGGGNTVYAPAVASDGAGWLVVRTEFQEAGVRATRIGADGSILGSFVIGAPWSSRPSDPAVVYGGGQYLVAWAEDAIEIRGVRVSSDGTILDAQPIAISPLPSPKAMGGAAFDGTSFLVAWADARRGDTSDLGYLAYDVYAARIAPNGTVLDADGMEVNALPGRSKSAPSVGAIPGGFAIAWWIDGYGGDAGVYAARVDGGGTLIDAPSSGPGLGVARSIGWSRAMHPVVVPAANGRTLVVWVENYEVESATKGIRAAVLAW